MISFSQIDYYYYQGEKVFLTKNYQYVNIVTANAFDETQLRTENKMCNGEFKKIAKLEFITTPSNQNAYEQE